MEISSTILERALESVNELALPIVAASCLFLTLHARPAAAAAMARPRRKRSRLVRRGASLLGLMLTLPSPSAAAGRRHPPASTASAAGVRMEPGRFPPPRLLGSAGPAIPGVESPPRTPVVMPPWTRPTSVHAAVHGGRLSETPERLFSRWRAAPPVGAHTTGSRSTAAVAERPQPPERAWHAVLPGDSLWSIAAEHLGTEDIRRIARYWPRIHRANRDVIGPNPDLLRPGQVLELPPEHA